MNISTGSICFALSATLAFVPLSGPDAAPPLQIAPSPQIAQVPQAPPDARPGRALIQQVQAALVRLGYDPGPADGLIGVRTTRSVRAFQQRNGLPVDGRVTPPLHRALLATIERQAAPTPAAAPVVAITGGTSIETAATPTDNTVPNAAAVAGATFVNSVWTITDRGGATLTLRLMADGKIADVESPVFWKWQLRGAEIRISYNNKLGGWVERRGQIVTADELRGEANSSRKRTWAWRARRNPTDR